MKSKQVLLIVVAFGLAGASWYLKNKEANGEGASDTEQVERGREVETPREPAQTIHGETLKVNSDRAGQQVRFTSVRVTRRDVDVLKNCTLIKHRHNDGDSFHVSHGGEKTEFRLYFVDTPESKFKTYRDGNSNGKRLSQQGAYFGGLDRDQTTTVGAAAKKFVLRVLAQKPFKVVTQWQEVYGPDRRYAFVIVEWEGQEVYLHELLVAKGLARIHTLPQTLPDNTAASRQRKHLKKLEAEAKKNRLGAWGL